jgi:acyl carrier protein
LTRDTATSVSKRIETDHQDLSILRQNLDLSTAYAEPVGANEEALADLWSEVLRIDQVGREDDFFELGGDSFAATVLAGLIEDRFGIEFSPADFIACSSIAQQALRIGATQSTPRIANHPSYMIGFNTAGKVRPLYIVHGARGFTFFNRTFLNELGSDQPVYLFQAPGMDGRAKPLTKVPDFAAHYISAIRAVQPHGPYQLAASCAGSLIALEMCHQLNHAGEKVEPLILLDPIMMPKALARRYPAVIRTAKGPWKVAQIRFKRLFLSCVNFVLGRGFTHNPPKPEWQAELDRVAYVQKKIIRDVGERRSKFETAERPVDLAYSIDDVMKTSLALDKALREYIPAAPYPGHAYMLVNQIWGKHTVRDDLFWNTHLGSFDYEIIPGGHDDIFDKYVLDTANFFKKHLSRSEGAASQIL